MWKATFWSDAGGETPDDNQDGGREDDEESQDIEVNILVYWNIHILTQGIERLFRVGEILRGMHESGR